jgi:hypothetical protein
MPTAGPSHDNGEIIAAQLRVVAWPFRLPHRH